MIFVKEDFFLFYDTLRDDCFQLAVIGISASKQSIICQSVFCLVMIVTTGLISAEAEHTFFFLHQDGRLRSGDHILRIGDTDLHGMGSEQVAQVLRQCGNKVKLVVTRGPVDETPSVSAIMPVVLPTVNEQQVNREAFSL